MEPRSGASTIPFGFLRRRELGRYSFRGLDFGNEKGLMISSLTSGEGLVCRFRGPGRVLIQTRNPASFGMWVRQFTPLQQQ